jgi:hypothetical protein
MLSSQIFWFHLKNFLAAPLKIFYPMPFSPTLLNIFLLPQHALFALDHFSPLFCYALLQTEKGDRGGMLLEQPFLYKPQADPLHPWASAVHFHTLLLLILYVFRSSLPFAFAPIASAK